MWPTIHNCYDPLPIKYKVQTKRHFSDCPKCGAVHKTLYHTESGWVCRKCAEAV